MPEAVAVQAFRSTRFRSASVARLELHAQPSRVLQPAADLSGEVLAIGHGGVVAERELIRLFQVTLGLAFPPSGNAAVCPSTPFGTIESDVRSRCRQPLSPAATLCSTAWRGWRPLKLQHPRAKHVLGKAVGGLMIGVLAYLLAESGDRGRIETSRPRRRRLWSWRPRSSASRPRCGDRSGSWAGLRPT